jgi:DNA replication protein DnaC
MQRNLNYCRKYAADFQPGAGSLLFSGATGLGKTFLSACIARQVTDRGFGVVYASAGKLFSDYEGVKFDRLDPGAIEGYTACDLLILDDLGTEMTTPLVISSLYQLVNSRILERKATLISTNLRPEDLEPRYGGQIASRLLGNYELVVFEGEDIRRLRNK